MRQLYSVFFALILVPLLSSAQFTPIGNAVPAAGTTGYTCFDLTPALLYQKGAVWANTPINLNQNFEVKASLYFGVNDGGGDGIAFVFQTEGTSYIGNWGAGLGYHRFNGPFPAPVDVPGPVPSFIVEFDTHPNVEIFGIPMGDPVGDHIGFQKNSDAYHTLGDALLPPVELGENLEDGVWRDVTFNWNASLKKMTVTFGAQVFTYTGDIVNSIFGGNGSVYWGFTASNGSFFPNEHKICIKKPSECQPGRTQTPGGWGAEPKGGNQGTYLHNHFAAAFPTGLVVGKTPGNNVKFTTAWAITNFLPSGGTPAKLAANATNPASGSIKNSFLDHMIALTLNVKFDQIDAGFSPSTIWLGNRIIGSGPFAGWTVSAFLTEANKILGGGASSYSVDDAHTTAAAINENYDNNTTDNGYLLCPPTTTATRSRASVVSETVVAAQGIKVMPNPAKGQFQLVFNSKQANAQVLLINANGTVVERRSVSAEQGQTMKFDLTKRAAGLYLVKVITADGEQVHKLVVQ